MEVITEPLITVFGFPVIMLAGGAVISFLTYVLKRFIPDTRNAKQLVVLGLSLLSGLVLTLIFQLKGVEFLQWLLGLATIFGGSSQVIYNVMKSSE
jgi:hypothetical protein